MEHRKLKNLNVNILWQCGTTRKSLIIKFSAFGKLSYITFLSIRINQVNLKKNFHYVPKSKMSVWWGKNPTIFFLKMQKKHPKHSQWTSKPLNCCFNHHIGPEYALTKKIFAKDGFHSAMISRKSKLKCISITCKCQCQCIPKYIYLQEAFLASFSLKKSHFFLTQVF